MAQQPADDWQAQPTTGTEARIGVPQIVQPNAGKSGALSDSIPWALQIMARLFRMVAGNYERTDSTIQAIQHRKGRGIEDDRLPAALAIRQKQTAALDIDVLPSQVQNLPQAAAGEEKEAKRRGRGWVNPICFACWCSTPARC
jgi:hypothetical protein